MTHLPAARPHQLALLARADASALAADRAVRRAWARVRAVIEAGGPWVVVYTRAREALRGVELAAAEILDDVRAAGASARTLARRRVKRAAARGLLEDESGGVLDPLVPDDLLPAVEDDLIDRIIYGAGWPERIAALTRLAAPDALAARIATGLQAGRTPRQVAADILPVVRGVKTSAMRTARTAALHVAHEAELATYEGMGPDFVIGYVVRAVLDAATRPEHRKRDGWEFYRTPKKGQRGFDQMPRPPRESPRDGGKWAFNCLMPWSVVQGTFDLALKSHYAGKAVEIHTAGGRTLSVTPNHPVCTRAGFVPAGQVREGDDLLCYSPEVGGGLGGLRENEQDRPSRVDEIFRAAEQLRPPRVERRSALDFHGDAEFGDGDIEVVPLGRVLVDRFEAGGAHGLDEFDLVAPGVAAGSGPRDGPAGLDLRRVDLTAAGGLRRRRLLRPLSLTHRGPLGPLRIGPASDIDARMHEYPVEAGRGFSGPPGVTPRDAQFARELLQRFAGAVSADQVVQVRHFDWSGHVYDLQSPGGWIVSDGVFVSNCRCRLEPIISEA